MDPLTNTCSWVKDLKVLPQIVGTKSDNFVIEFKISLKAKRLKTKNRYIPNFKKANWSAINFELNRINWDRVLKYCEPEIAWRRFKHI